MCSVANLLLCAVCLRVVGGFSHYQQQIPNGQWVPSPCEQGEVWMGVGHMNPAGGGPRNPFGRDFANNDHVGLLRFSHFSQSVLLNSENILYADASIFLQAENSTPRPTLRHVFGSVNVLF